MPEKIAISALICEFDPLHFGHREILSQMRAAGGAVCCIMSGNFVQRGGPAMLDKWSRALPRAGSVWPGLWARSVFILGRKTRTLLCSPP